ncbi:interleukin-6 receptor subunit beta [Pholidichthys leucotaenia]
MASLVGGFQDLQYITALDLRKLDKLIVQVRNVTVRGYTFRVCGLNPDTLYNIKLRNRYLGPESPWSPWSNTLQGQTAPSVALPFWRQVKQTSRTGWRNVSLLWKPLPHFLVNGRVLFYNVTCRTKNAQVLRDHGSCRDLHLNSTSCSLYIPAGRCSCTLTVSTSAGESQEAQMWLRGADETEPPPVSNISLLPLDDNRLEVSWLPAVDPAISSFVVEWLAVRDDNSSILYWGKLNASCSMMVIKEGIKAMERYSVSVRALYGERGAGKDMTLNVYTRQGTPSAGPNVVEHHISGSSVYLRWSRVPVELLHGFISHYTLYYTSRNQTTHSVTVPREFHNHTLQNLSPGTYSIFMRAHTVAGAGAAGPQVSVHIRSEETPVVMYAVVSYVMSFLVLVLMVCLARTKTVKQKLCHDVPDPSNSSMSHWNPKATLEDVKQLVMLEKPVIKYSQVVSFASSPTSLSYNLFRHKTTSSPPPNPRTGSAALSVLMII